MMEILMHFKIEPGDSGFQVEGFRGTRIKPRGTPQLVIEHTDFDVATAIMRLLQSAQGVYTNINKERYLVAHSRNLKKWIVLDSVEGGDYLCVGTQEECEAYVEEMLASSAKKGSETQCSTTNSSC